MLVAGEKTPRTYLIAGAILFIAQLALFVFGLPPFQSLLFPRLDNVVTAYLFFAALSALWIGFGTWRHWLDMQRPIHPLWWIMFAWIGWQLVCMPFAASFWRDWFGHPEHGVGIAWNIALLLATMIGTILWPDEKIRRAILIAAFVLLAAQVVPYALWNEKDSMGIWRPTTNGAYLGFMVGWLWIALMCAYGQSVRWLLFFAFAAAFGLAISENKSAMLLFLPVMVIAYASREYADWKIIRNPPASIRKLAMIFMILPMTWVYISLDASHFTNRKTSMAIRATINEAAVETIEQNPTRWLMGKGWGSFIDDGFKHALTQDSVIYRNGIYDPDAPLVTSPAFHSHNQPLEALLCLGIIGLLLWYALPLFTIHLLPREQFWLVAPMLIAIISMSHVWFYIPQQLGYIALGWAALLAMTSHSAARAPARRGAVLLFCTSLSGILLVSAWSQNQAVKYSDSLYRAAFRESYERYSYEWLEQDFARNADRLNTAALYRVTQAAVDGSLVEPNNAGWMRHFLFAARALALEGKSGVSSESLELALYNILGEYSPRFFEEELKQNWQNSVIFMAAAAPQRDDLSALYTLNLLRSHPDAPQMVADALQPILEVSPGNRICLYHIGMARWQMSPSDDTAKNTVKQSISNGVTSVFPIRYNDIEKLPFIN